MSGAGARGRLFHCMEKTYPTLQEVLEKLVGTALSSVVFVEDYVQLEWEGSCLSAYIMPTIVAAGRSITQTDPEFREMMYGLEGRLLERPQVTDEALNLFFSGGTVLSVSMRDADYVGPEALWYWQGDGLSYVV